MIRLGSPAERPGVLANGPAPAHAEDRRRRLRTDRHPPSPSPRLALDRPPSCSRALSDPWIGERAQVLGESMEGEREWLESASSGPTRSEEGVSLVHSDRQPGI